MGSEMRLRNVECCFHVAHNQKIFNNSKTTSNINGPVTEGITVI